MMQEEYYQRYGEEMAEWALKEELKHYIHIVLIDSGRTDIKPLRATGRENADYFGLEYLEFSGMCLNYLQSLICGPHDDQNSIILEPDSMVKQNFF